MNPTTDKVETTPELGLADMMPKVTRPLHINVGPAARSQQTLADAPPITMRRKRHGSGAKWRRRLVLVVLAIAASTTAIWYRDPLMVQARSLMGPKTSLTLANIQTYTAKRGELRITMLEEGKLRAVNNSTIRMGVSGKITWLAEAGSKVKKGDKLAVIDTKQYEDQKKTLEGTLNTQQQMLEIAEYAVPIAEAEGEAMIANAKSLLKTAELALKQYISIDVPKKLNDLETAANDARIKLSDQTKKRADLQKQLDEMLNEGPEKAKLQSDLEIAKTTEMSLRKTVTTAEDGRKLFRSHSYMQDLGTKQRAVENAKLDVTKAETKAKNDVLSKKNDVQRLRTTVAQIQNQIKTYELNIERGTAISPTDGLVFYGGSDLERYGLSADQIKVGADWYSNQPLMSIPDLSAFQVAVPVPEVYRGRVSNGMPATVLIDAIPGLVLNGKLTSVSSVSRPKFASDSTSPPVYDAMIALDLADPRMVAGMTVRVEIATATLPDVLYVPVEAVYNEEGKTAAFVWVDGRQSGEGHLEKRPALTGQSNDHFVEIKNGLKEGDRLALSRPASFVTPPNYREQVDAMFPAIFATTAPAVALNRGAPNGPPGAERLPTSRPAGAAVRQSVPPTTNPGGARSSRGAARGPESAEAEIIASGAAATTRPGRAGNRAAGASPSPAPN